MVTGRTCQSSVRLSRFIGRYVRSMFLAWYHLNYASARNTATIWWAQIFGHGWVAFGWFYENRRMRSNSHCIKIKFATILAQDLSSDWLFGSTNTKHTVNVKSSGTLTWNSLQRGDMWYIRSRMGIRSHTLSLENVQVTIERSWAMSPFSWEILTISVVDLRQELRTLNNWHLHESNYIHLHGTPIEEHRWKAMWSSPERRM